MIADGLDIGEAPLKAGRAIKPHAAGTSMACSTG
jgi:hypothetical protein